MKFMNSILKMIGPIRPLLYIVTSLLKNNVIELLLLLLLLVIITIKVKVNLLAINFIIHYIHSL